MIFSDRHVWRMDFFRIILVVFFDFLTITWNSDQRRCHLKIIGYLCSLETRHKRIKSARFMNHKSYEMSHILIICYAYLLRFVLCKETADNTEHYIGTNYGYKINTARSIFGSIRHLGFLE